MQLTRAADYAVRALIHLAGLERGARASLEDLAKSAEVPEHFMSKVLQALTRSGLIHSFRGSNGGFELALPADEITMLRAVEAIDGPIELNLCLMAGDPCGRATWCAAHQVWLKAQAAMVAILKDATIGRLAQESAARRAALEATSPE